MNTAPNTPVSDARLREIIDSPRPKLAATATEVEAALRELQARRAADATRESASGGHRPGQPKFAGDTGVTLSVEAPKPAPGVVEALREMVARHPENTGARAAAVAALAANDAAQAQRDPVQAVLAEVGAALRAKPAIQPPTGIGQYVPSGVGNWPRERVGIVQTIADLVFDVADKDASEKHARLAEQRIRLDREAREKGAAT